MRDDTAHQAAQRGSLGRAEIPVGDAFWRGLGRNGALVAGYALLGLHVLVVLVAGLLSLIDGTDDDTIDAAQKLALGSTVLLPLLGSTALFIGELQRRGTMGRNARQRTDTLLPQGTNVSLWRMVSPRWNAVWAAASLLGCALLTWAGADPELGHGTPAGSSNWALWSIHAFILAGFAGQNAGSWLKKVVWARHLSASAADAARASVGGMGAARPSSSEAQTSPGAEHPIVAARLRAQLEAQPAARSERFWRVFSFRWRFDIWLCAIGAVAVWVAVFFLASTIEAPDDAPSLTLAAAIVAPAGLAMLGIGLWATTQFWRAGEDLAAGESLA